MPYLTSKRKRLQQILTFRPFVLIFALTLSSHTSANQAELATQPIKNEASQVPSAPPEPSALRWLIDNRNYWGKVVGDTGSRLDAFFAGEDVIEKTNNSFLKLGLQFQQFKSERSYLEPKIKFRLDLPTVEEKIRFVFESDPTEEQTIEEQKSAQGSERNSKDLSESTVGALDLALKQKRNWSSSTGIGVKFGDPIDPFWRFRIRGVYALTSVWALSSNDSLYFFHDEGWGAKAEITLQRNGPWFVFRQTSDGRYDYDDRRWELGHTYSFLSEIDAQRAINYQIGVIAETQPEVQATGYFAHAIYRRKLHKNWLFYEMTPELYYPKDANWKPSPSITLKVEMVLSAKEQ